MAITSLDAMTAVFFAMDAFTIWVWLEYRRDLIAMVIDAFFTYLIGTVYSAVITYENYGQFALVGYFNVALGTVYAIYAIYNAVKVLTETYGLLGRRGRR